MKKTSFAVTLMIATVLCAGCAKEQVDSTVTGNTDNQSLEEFFLTNSISLTEKMDSMAEDDTILSMYQTPSSLMDLVTEIGSGDYDRPVEAYMISYDLDTILEYLELESGTEDKLTEEQKELLGSKMTGANFCSILNGSYGAEFLATTGTLTIGQGYQMPNDWDKNTLVYLVYDGTYSSLTAFYQSGEGVVNASSYFVMTDDETLTQLKQYGMKVNQLDTDLLMNLE